MASLNKIVTLSIAEVRERMLKMLSDSGLDEKDARRMKCEPLTAAECAKRNVTSFPGAGFTIPYFNTAGRVTKFFRFRYVEDVGRNGLAGLTRKKQLRYVQPAGILPTVYWAPLAPWDKIVASEEPLFITEGEKKAACATKNGFATLGLGGVWSFKSKDKNVSLIDELDSIDWTGRRVYIVYDSDAVCNRNVLMAETELARQLLDKGALVLTVRLPDNPDTGDKMGVDDYIVANGRDAFQHLVDSEAEEFTNSKALHELNKRCTVLLHPPVIYDNENRRLIPTEKFVNHTHAHLKHTIAEQATSKSGEPITKMTEKRTAKEWVLWPGRASADSLVYVPGGDEYIINERGKRAINAWEGWGCEPKKGDIGPWKTLFEFITAGNEPAWTEWFEQWLAYPIQHPGTKLFSAVVVWSVHQGTGKSFIAHIMKRIYGDNFSEIGMDDIYSNFNTWQVNRQFILGEEIAGGENKRVLSDRLKKIITQPEILVNTKFIPQYKVKDSANFYFTSNHPDAFYLEDTDRRFFVQEVRNPPMSHDVYKEIDLWTKGDGPAALMYHLLHVDLEGFNPQGPPPLTKAKEDMRHESKSEVGRWVEELKRSPEGKLIVAGKPMEYTIVTTGDLYKMYDPENRRGQMLVMSKELRRAGVPRAYNGEPVKIGASTARLWIVNGDVAKIVKMSPKQLADLYIKEHGDGTRKF